MISLDYTKGYHYCENEDEAFNMLQVRSSEKYLNQLFKIHGYLSLNRVRSHLGFYEELKYQKYVYIKPITITYDPETKTVTLPDPVNCIDLEDENGEYPGRPYVNI